MFYKQSDDNDRITLYEKYKLVERTEPEFNGVWKGAHLLLFFLAFVFGSFCTFCFHMLMYLFDEKCVLFPKLLSLTSFRQSIIYEFIPEDKDVADSKEIYEFNMATTLGNFMNRCALPVDFLSTQWVEKSTCLLPTYVPLVSSIFGLIWTTMFLMCSIGSRVLTGLQRPWRVLPPVFLFSIVMGGVCIYTSAVTHYGLQELCVKLNEITGSSSCTYTINVATLVYQRRIRGVYQATRLTIISAWLHTGCWLMSALLALARVLLAVDFKLVRINVELRGNIDRMLEHHEKHIRTISPAWLEQRSNIPQRSHSSIKLHFMKKNFRPNLAERKVDCDLLYCTGLRQEMSELALVTTERFKLDKLAALNSIPEEHHFIVKILYILLHAVDASDSSEINSYSSSSDSILTTTPIVRQFGQQQISSTVLLPRLNDPIGITYTDIWHGKDMPTEIKSQLEPGFNKELDEPKVITDHTSKNIALRSSLNVSSELRLDVDKKKKLHIESDSANNTAKGKAKTLKSSLKQASVQTDENAKDKSQKVHINSKTYIPGSSNSQYNNEIVSKETQTKKEKQD